MNMAYNKFKNHEDFTLEEIKNIHKELEGRQWAEFEIKKSITSLEFRFMEEISTIETKEEVTTLKIGTNTGGFTSPDRDREPRVDDTKTPIFKGVRDAEEIDKFLWQLGYYFKCSQVRSDENKINIVVL